jgi:hypothetical protein
MPSSCHTRWWCNRSGCSQCCTRSDCHIFSLSWGGKYVVVVPSSRLPWCVWTMIVCWWCGHQGTWNARPAPLQPCRCERGRVLRFFVGVDKCLVSANEVWHFKVEMIIKILHLWKNWYCVVSIHFSIVLMELNSLDKEKCWENLRIIHLH